MERITADQLTNAHKGRTFVHNGSEFVLLSVAEKDGGWREQLQVTLTVARQGQEQGPYVVRYDDPVDLL
ncbi:hypothetical protein BH686_07075 [Rhodococcus erythropolis]|uniref:hypothetical protein n=1 Tax=Rhodococcus erythropolis TaxID=1833 RepID=UPI000A00A9B6|nr:hypothetical protein [Rhodococcus erythropolis]ORI19928.1 hypothetical protein BH686_07075 [Rhodococcus erythropolis]